MGHIPASLLHDYDDNDNDLSSRMREHLSISLHTQWLGIGIK
jgi:hypothetical protein